jgi:anaphase-promoting complex subunit 3
MYGVGQIYFRQEKYDMALVQFKSASLVNPGSSVLHCYTAMALHRQGFLDRALSKVSEAICLDPKNPLARFEKAAVLASMEQHALALKELQVRERHAHK